MSEVISLSAVMRNNLGTGAARELRRQGMVPAIIYQTNSNSLPIAISEKEITKLYRKPHFITRVIQLEIAGKSYKVLPKSVELHPVFDIVNHIDFIPLANQDQQLEVPIVFAGKERALGVKRGGVFNTIARTLLLQCPVADIPKCVTVDVTEMRVGQLIRANDVLLPPGCTLLIKTNPAIASIIGAKGAKAEEGESSTETSV